MIIQFLFVYEYLKSADRDKIFRWRTSARVGPHTPYLFIFLLLRMTPAYLNPADSPAATVVWKGQVIPVLQTEAKKD